MAHLTATQATASLVSLLGEARLILVSNREPYSHRWHRQVLAASAGGVPAATGATNGEGARVFDVNGNAPVPSSVIFSTMILPLARLV